MLDQDTALALLTVANETDATVALVSDRAQLAAVRRGGVLDVAEVHRFTGPTYADLTVQTRDRRDRDKVLDQLQRLGLVHMHVDAERLRGYIAQRRHDGEALTVASNEGATQVNRERWAEHRAR